MGINTLTQSDVFSIFCVLCFMSILKHIMLRSLIGP